MCVYLRQIKVKRDRCGQASCPCELDDAGRGVDRCLGPVSRVAQGCILRGLIRDEAGWTLDCEGRERSLRSVFDSLPSFLSSLTEISRVRKDMYNDTLTRQHGEEELRAAGRSRPKSCNYKRNCMCL